MASFYDEIEIEDFEYDSNTATYYYPCPCGDQFQITEEELYDGEEIARCPSCSLMIRVVYEADRFVKVEDRIVDSRLGSAATRA